MNTSTKKGKGLGEYMPLAFAAGIGSMLGSGIIVGLSATIVVWQEGLGLDTTQVGLLSGILTFAIAFGSLFGGRLADKIGRVLFFNWINLFYAIGAVICVFAPNFTVLLIGLIIAGLASGADLPVSMTIAMMLQTRPPPHSSSPPPRCSGRWVCSSPSFARSWFPPCRVPPVVVWCSPSSQYSL